MHPKSKAPAFAALVAWMLEKASQPRPVKPARASRSKYMPHQGKRECARRVRQMAKAA